jgi:hypothetical protein
MKKYDFEFAAQEGRLLFVFRRLCGGFFAR